MAPLYPELSRDAANIRTVIDAEEAAFASTLRTGTAIFDASVEENRRKNSAALSGAQAFQLHDTYGFPIDLTLEMAAEQGLTVDEEGFRLLMAEQRDRAKRDAAEKKTGNADISAFAEMLERSGTVTFTGYDQISGEATDPRPAGQRHAGARRRARAPKWTWCSTAPRSTPRAAASSPTRAPSPSDGGVVAVSDVQTPLPGLIVHRGRVSSGEVRASAPAFAEIDVERRRALSRSHTATHLVHRALRDALGESAAQAGSENAPGRLRFDFTAPGAVPLSALRDTEDVVNEVLVNDLDVRAFYTSQEEAREMGALALFGEKYGDRVRVVEVGDYSRELCGGTHVARSGQLGLIKVLGEASIGSGVRRIEALVGIDAFRFLARESTLVSQLSEQFKTPREQLPERISAVVTRLRDAERELQRLRAARLLESAGEIAAGAEDINGIALVAHRVPDGTEPDDIRKLALDVRGRVPRERPAVVAVIGVPADKPVVVIAVNEAGRGFGLAAGSLVGTAARALGGNGGGKPDVAQGGGASISDSGPGVIDEAFEAVRGALRDITGSGR